ncbi:hypothetical protein, partial [Shigella sonnei]
LRLAAEPQTGRREVSALTDARKTLAYDFFRILRAPLLRSITVPCYPGLWQISFPGRKLLKTDGMNTVSSQSDLHSLSCIAMQRAENDPDASFLFFRGKTSIFVVSASESRSARFSGAYN